MKVAKKIDSSIFTSYLRNNWFHTRITAFKVISEIKFANGRIPSKPNAVMAIDRTLLEGLYENSQ